jgi:hypothetical protein
MPRMRTINEAHRSIKDADPDTSLSPFAIRRLILTGAIPSITAGNKYLIDLDALEEYLSNPVPKPQAAIITGQIRPVSGKRA